MKKLILVSSCLFVCFSTAGIAMRFATWPMGFGDSDLYLRMAESPGLFVGSPWGYRIAVPYLASLVSSVFEMTIENGFGIIQLVFYSAFLTCLFLWLRYRFEIGAFVATLTCSLFIFSYPGVYNLHNFVHVGFAEHFFVLIGCVAIYGGKNLILVAIVALSCFVKESVGLLLVPSFSVFEYGTKGWRVALRNTAVLLSVFVVLSLALRSGLFFFEGTNLSSYSSFYTLDYMRFVHAYLGGLWGALTAIAYSFYSFLILAVIGFAIAPPKLKLLSVLPVLATLQIALATDVERMVGAGIPVLCVLSAFTLSRINRRDAFVLTAISGFQFLCLNHGVFPTASLVGSALSSLVILWWNRSAFILRGDPLPHAPAGSPRD